MIPAFIQKLRAASQRTDDLSAEDTAVAMTLCDHVSIVRPRRDLIREGEHPAQVVLIVEGWACRYKMLPDGSRQILAFLIPGDFCDSHVTIFDRMDHSIATITECKVASIPCERMIEIANHPRIGRALCWAALVDAAILRSWIVNLGRRDSFERVGHLICELHARLRNVGLAEENVFTMPITQEELADALGLTPVHVNRTLKRLRDDLLVTFRGRRITIGDIAALQQAVGFDPNYLHLTRSAAGA